MLKKKNIAMVMAAATVATSVAPVFAAQVEDKNVDEATLRAEVEKMLNTKYSYSTEDGDGKDDTKATDKGMEYTNSIYEITVSNGAPIKSMGDLEVAIAKAKNEKKELILTVTDKGHKTVDGKIIAVENNKNKVYVSQVKDSNEEVALSDVTLTNSKIGTVSDVDGKKVIQLTSGVEIELGLGSYVLDLTRPIDANGKLIDITTGDVATGKKVVGFEYKEADNAFEKDIPSKSLDNLVFNGTDVQKIDFKLSDLVVETNTDGAESIYTKEGKVLVDLLGDIISNGENISATVKNGKEYQIKFVKASDLGPVKVSKDGGYELTIGLEVVEKKADFASEHKANVKLVIKSDVQADLANLRTTIDGATSATDVKTSKYDSLSGDNRFETAVKISDRTFATEKTAKAVILVGENAIVDGLAAAPLAKQEEAPILLTKKDLVPSTTMAEIKRVAKVGAPIYLIGGENTISKEVEAQLIKEMNAKIVRLAGDDRYDTSLKISKKLTTPVSKAFVVGGDGLADAMSVAAVAAQKEAPIIVSPAEGLTKDAKDFLYANRNVAGFGVDVIGGSTKVSDQVITDIEANTNLKDVKRISGKDRNDTNAKVISEYFEGKKLANVYVAKDGDAQLVDALAAAPLVGKSATLDGAIVLATNDITKAQLKAIEDNKTGVKAPIQIGNGIALKVMDAVAKLLK